MHIFSSPNTILKFFVFYLKNYGIISVGVKECLPAMKTDITLEDKSQKKDLIIDTKYYGVYVVLSSIIVCFLNKTIKPVLFRFTIPITGITLGLFYPCINILILKLVDLILGSHFETQGIITLFLTAILISFMHMFMENVITKFIFRKGVRNEFSSV